MLTLLNNILDKTLGLRVYKTSDRHKNIHLNQQNKSTYVEFVGVPAVGKSTLYNKYFEIKKEKVLQDSTFLALEKVDRNISIDIPIYKNIAQLKIDQIIQSEYLPTDKMRFLNWFYTVLINDFHIYNFNQNNTLVAEEGLLHNFGNVLMQYLKSKKEKHDILKDRAIVYCYAPDEVISERVLKRKKETKKIVPQHKNKSPIELQNHVKFSLQEKNHQIDFFKELKIPVLKVNTAEDLILNAQKVRQFICDLQDRKEFTN